MKSVKLKRKGKRTLNPPKPYQAKSPSFAVGQLSPSSSACQTPRLTAERKKECSFVVKVEMS